MRKIVALILLVAGGALAAQPSMLGGGRPVTMDQIPPASGLRKNLEKLPPKAQTRALRWLQSFPFPKEDAAQIRATTDGSVFYVCASTPTAVEGVSNVPAPDIGEGLIPVAPFPNSLKVHSRPSSTKVLYLDFDGEAVSDTAWDTGTFYAVSFSLDTDLDTYSDEEQSAVLSMWQRVSEDFAPFDVDVTTERPVEFHANVAHAVITKRVASDGRSLPYDYAGGVAFVNVFGWSDFGQYSPAWVYYDNLSFWPPYIAEATSHELGHNLGLGHDGTTDGASYYYGHGDDFTRWAPIMGAGYYSSLTQWSRGDYFHANNTEDDLAIISVKVGYRGDDIIDSFAFAPDIVVGPGNMVEATTPATDPANTNSRNKGVINAATDVDSFRLTVPAGVINLDIDPLNAGGYLWQNGQNLDVQVSLHDANGNVLATDNPAGRTTARIRHMAAAGTYYVNVRSAGLGDPLANPPSGYTTYGCLGQYFITGDVAAASIRWDTAHSSMTIAGTFNGWNSGLNNMRLVDDRTWQADITVTNQSAVRFKFAFNGNWGFSVGESDQGDRDLPIGGTGEDTDASDITINGTLSGTYRFTFDEWTYAYSVEFVPPSDTDGDGMPDYWESQYRLDPNNASDAGLDPDGDGFTNLREFQRGSNPNQFNAKLSAYTSMTMASPLNGWSAAATNMTLLDDYLWQGEVDLVASAFRFKFAANKSWAANWGEQNQGDFTMPMFGTAELGNANITVNGAVNGRYEFLFNEQTRTYSVSKISGPPESSYLAMTVAGTFNGWSAGANNMSLVADYTWETTMTLTNATAARFKFAANSSWTSNWGESNQSDKDMPIAGQFAEANAANILINGTLTGVYRFMFNEQTRAYTVTKVGGPWASVYGKVNVAGAFNGWSAAASNLTLVADNTWQGDIVFNNTSGVRFKFTANNSWATNFGEQNQTVFTVPMNATAVLGNYADIIVNSTLNGNYRFTLNDATRAYALINTP